jgi:hypothetical protein
LDWSLDFLYTHYFSMVNSEAFFVVLLDGGEGGGVTRIRNDDDTLLTFEHFDNLFSLIYILSKGTTQRPKALIMALVIVHIMYG